MSKPTPGKKPLKRVAIIDEDQPTVLRTIRGLKDGTVSPRGVRKEDRKLVVDFLTAQGQTMPEIAEIFGLSERTIYRDKEEVRSARALKADPELPGKLAGRLLHEADLAISNIRRALRGSEVPAAVRIDGEHRCYQIVSDMVQRMQSLGYAPTAAQKLEAQLTHAVAHPPTFEELVLQAEQLELAAAAGPGVDKELAIRITEVKEVAVRYKLQDRMKQICATGASGEQPT